ncbi:Fc.00g025720.m01.CDS01 [Cosmosporella sp. VM-42]
MALVIHHLHVSQSERIPWLCEELGIEYLLKTYKRAPLLAPPEYKALHPMGTAPVIQDGCLTLGESCACIEYICHKYGKGKLFLPCTDPNYANFLYWWHWADGTFQPALLRAMFISSNEPSSNNILATIAKDRFNKALGGLNERLAENEWLVGSEFTVADVMVVFSLTTMRYYSPYSLHGYGNVLEYLKRISGRAAYLKAMEKCDPGMELVLGADPPKVSFM